MFHFKGMMKTKRRQAGLSLVELMVAIAVGLILLAGLIQLLVSNKQAYRLQEGILDMQENARYSLQTLSYDLRMADHWGGVEGDTISLKAAISGCKKELIDFDSGLMGLRGFEGGSTAPTPTGCINNSDYVANSDVIVVRYASVDSRVATGDLDSTDNKDDLFIGSVSGMGGTLNKGSDLKSDVTQGMDGVYNYPFYLAAYFIRPCSVMGDNAVCDATDDNGSPIPTLTRLILRGTSVAQEAVAQGVEQMQIEYGIGMGGDVDEYKDVDDMTSSDWKKVSAVRIALVTRSGSRDFSYTDPKNSSSNVYDLPGDDSDDDYFVTGDAAHYRRKVITQVIQVRNSGRN